MNFTPDPSKVPEAISTLRTVVEAMRLSNGEAYEVFKTLLLDSMATNLRIMLSRDDLAPEILHLSSAALTEAAAKAYNESSSMAAITPMSWKKTIH